MSARYARVLSTGNKPKKKNDPGRKEALGNRGGANLVNLRRPSKPQERSGDAVESGGERIFGSTFSPFISTDFGGGERVLLRKKEHCRKESKGTKKIAPGASSTEIKVFLEKEWRRGGIQGGGGAIQ